MQPAQTRARILEAALGCFLQEGYEQTTVARIRERSGVSNGALFHHFASKEAIADALYLEAIRSFQEGLWKLVRRRQRSLRAAVRGTIAHQMAWIEAHPDHARFVYARGDLDWDSPAGAEVATLNRELADAFRSWVAPLVERGQARPLPMLVVSAIVSGPAHAIARRWLSGQLDRPLSDFLDELANAAWAGLRGKPVAPRRAPRAVADRGRLTLELVSEDGSVLARGRVTTELHPTAADQT